MGCKGVIYDGAFPLGEIINRFNDGYVSIKDIDIYIDYRNKEEIVDVIFWPPRDLNNINVQLSLDLTRNLIFELTTKVNKFIVDLSSMS